MASFADPFVRCHIEAFSDPIDHAPCAKGRGDSDRNRGFDIDKAVLSKSTIWLVEQAKNAAQPSAPVQLAAGSTSEMYLEMALIAAPKAFMCSIEHMTFMNSLSSVARYSPSAREVSSGGKPPAASGSSTRDQSKDDRSSFRIVPEMVEHRTNQGTVGIGDEAGDLQAHDPLTRTHRKAPLAPPASPPSLLHLAPVERTQSAAYLSTR